MLRTKTAWSCPFKDLASPMFVLAHGSCHLPVLGPDRGLAPMTPHFLTCSHGLHAKAAGGAALHRWTKSGAPSFPSARLGIALCSRWLFYSSCLHPNCSGLQARHRHGAVFNCKGGSSSLLSDHCANSLEAGTGY